MGREILQEAQAERGSGRVAKHRARIAWMYYVEGLTQNQIAEELGIGRVTVVRNINEAIRQREVKIWIDGEVSECLALERELKRAFGLEDCVVVPEPAQKSNIAKSIGFAAGIYASGQIHDHMTIGVGWGATLYESLRTLSPRDTEDVQVVSLLGGIVEARRFNPSEFAWQFANAIGADCYLLAAPAIVDSLETRTALIERCGLSAVFERAAKMQIALLSTGNMSAQSTAQRLGFFADGERQSLIDAGAVGDLLYNFFDASGALIDHPMNRRIISFPIEQVRAVPRRVLVSGGNEKIACMLGAMKLIRCNVLITNEATARELLSRGP